MFISDRLKFISDEICYFYLTPYSFNEPNKPGSRL